MTNDDSKVIKTDEEWRKILTPEQYRVLRQKGTESPGSGEYENNEDSGMYLCAACGNEVFASDTKFHSGSGWPSFYAPAGDEKIKTTDDSAHGMQRVEVTCNKCGGHLGHVFDDGPKSMPDGTACTGKRFCINSAALKLEKKPK